MCVNSRVVRNWATSYERVRRRIRRELMDTRSPVASQRGLASWMRPGRPSSAATSERSRRTVPDLLTDARREKRNLFQASLKVGWTDTSRPRKICCTFAPMPTAGLEHVRRMPWRAGASNTQEQSHGLIFQHEPEFVG